MNILLKHGIFYVRKNEDDWVSPPHFYKKGTIIVQYLGEEEKIQSDLKEILGEQFAGYKK